MTYFLIGAAIGCLVGYFVRDKMPPQGPTVQPKNDGGPGEENPK